MRFGINMPIAEAVKKTLADSLVSPKMGLIIHKGMPGTNRMLNRYKKASFSIFLFNIVSWAWYFFDKNSRNTKRLSRNAVREPRLIERVARMAPSHVPNSAPPMTIKKRAVGIAKLIVSVNRKQNARVNRIGDCR